MFSIDRQKFSRHGKKIMESSRCAKMGVRHRWREVDIVCGRSFWVAHSSRVLVSASRGNKLLRKVRAGEDDDASTRDACATQITGVPNLCVSCLASARDGKWFRLPSLGRDDRARSFRDKSYPSEPRLP